MASRNLLSLARGAGIVSRTAELDLTNSALRAIDGDWKTEWVTPPGDPQQEIVFSFAAPARIEKVGVLTTSKKPIAAGSVRFEFSVDGKQFSRPMELRVRASDEEQRFAVRPPVDARFLRFSLLDGGRNVVVREVLAEGTQAEAAMVPSIDGCWRINDQPSAFRSSGSEVAGHVGGIDETTLEGGFDGGIYRFAWIRGAEFGLAAMTVAADGSHLASLVWHEEAIQAPQFFADDWFGERCASPGAAEPRLAPSVFREYLSRFGFFPLYGLRFASDGTLDESASAATLDRVVRLLAANPQLKARLVAHELRRGSAAENLAVSRRKSDTLKAALLRIGIDSARVAFVTAGEANPHREASNDVTRAMYSSVDLEIRR